MAKTVLKNVSILYGGYDLTSVTNSIDLGLTGDTKESTNYASNGWREYLAGLREAAWQYQGFHDFDFDAAFFNGVSVATPAPTLVTLSQPIVADDIAYAMSSVGAQYTRGETVGELAGYGLQIKGAALTTRGQILEKVTSTATGNSAAKQRSATLSTQTLHAFLFVTAVSGTTPTLDVVVQSDDAVGFASATARITFDQVTAIGAQYKTLAGPITDDYFRVARTIGGTDTPTFSYVVMLAIQ